MLDYRRSTSWAIIDTVPLPNLNCVHQRAYIGRSCFKKSETKLDIKLVVSTLSIEEKMLSMREISEKMLNIAKVLNGRLQDKEKVVQRKTKRSFSIIEEQAAEELIFQIYLCTSSRHRKRRSVVSIWSFLANSCRTKIPFFPIPLVLPTSDPVPV